MRAKNIAAEIIAVGTNAYAASAMQKAGADKSATGENAVLVNVPEADIITGPIGIVMANSLMGEITAKMAQAVSSCKALKVLIPLNKCGTVVAGAEGGTLSQNITEAVNIIARGVN